MKEDALPGTVVSELKVYDYDLEGESVEGDSSNNIEYYITSGNVGQHFHIRRGGQIYVARTLDRESISRYKLKITVTDGIFVSKASVLVEVIDVDGKIFM